MATPPKTDSYAWQAPAQVRTDPQLWCTITSFQCGLPLPLYAFWVAHEPEVAHSKDRNLIYNSISRLLELVVKHGTVEMLDALATVRYYYRDSWSECRSVDFSYLVDGAVFANRADMFEWAFTHNARVSNLRDVWDTAIRYHQTGDLRVLDLLRAHKSIAATKLQGLMFLVEDAALARWLDVHFPGAINEHGCNEIMTNAATGGNVALVKYLLENHSTTDFGSWPCDLAYQRRRLDVLRCLVEEQLKYIDHEVIKRAIRDWSTDAIEIFSGYGNFYDVASEVANEYIVGQRTDKLLQLLDGGIFPSGHRFSIDEGAASGESSTIYILTEQNLATATMDAMDRAAENRQWKVVRYLHDHRSDGCAW